MYKKGHNTYYGKIKKIILINEKFFLLITKLETENLKILQKLNDTNLNSALSSFHNYFKSFKETSDFDLVDIDEVLIKCIILCNEDFHMITHCVSFEHD